MKPRQPDLHSEPYELDVFGSKTCSRCGEAFAANTDYFAPDGNRDGLSANCRNCRRERDRIRYQDPAVRAYRLSYERRRYAGRTT